ncbi:dephospho-CoA kinase [Sphingomonas yunnanensis]|uniref:dephospho-CoA kinase n=1 Tax=Sphingomonas yunnanensis TaxID=310400 RepID=UPI001CA7B0AE|nr:dephospho-CoA kinase [Sphingomonas yunnanensis]MBY9063194.1 dephospho-CoA kinase [Sphingomonas yunnanensis]
MIVLGLTGSIGMGKTTVARLFAEAGVPVFDADAVVHRLQGRDGALVAAIAARFPGTAGAAGVDRAALGAAVLGDKVALRDLEAIVHPAVAAERAAFLARHATAPLVVLDVPLLFETGGDAAVDRVAVVSAASAVQRERTLARPGMTAAKLDSILARQLPDAEKRARADVVIATDVPIAETRAAVRRLIACAGAAAGR